MRTALIPVFGAAAIAGIFLAHGKSPDVCLAAYGTSLEGRTEAQRHNAELSLACLKGAVIKPGETFSFNRRVGSWSRDRGYKRAPVSYNGTLIASWGGGVCQTSTTLYNAAILAGMEIVERSSHRFCPDYVPPGRDAAVAFSDVDLKFRNPLNEEVRIDGRIEGNRLVLGLYAREPLRERPQIVTEMHQVIEPRVFRIAADAGTNQLKNTGKPGYDVETYRVTSAGREMLSVDNYPPMNRIVEADDRL